MNHWWTRAKIIGSLAALVGSFVMSAVTWVGIGGIAGYGPMQYVMPLVVDAYIVCAIATRFSTESPGVKRSAYYHALSAAIIGTVAQAIYHCAITWAGAPLSIFGWTWNEQEHPHELWAAIIAFIAGGLPPSFAFLGVHLLGIDQQATVNGVTGYTAPNGSGGEDSHITQEVSAAGWSAADPAKSPLGPPPHITGAANHPAGASAGSHQPSTPTPPLTPTSPFAITAPTMPAQTASPTTFPPAEATPQPPAPAQSTTACGSTAARGHSNTEWARGVTRPTQPRRGSVLSDQEWEQMDGWIDDGVRDYEIGKRMGRSEATVKKRRLERMARRAQRNGNERMARQ